LGDVPPVVLDGSNLDHPASVLHGRELFKGRSGSDISARAGYWAKEEITEVIIAFDFLTVGVASVLVVLLLTVIGEAGGLYGEANRSPRLNQLHDLFTSRSPPLQSAPAAAAAPAIPYAHIRSHTLTYAHIRSHSLTLLPSSLS
jgi:uncharacterized membrane protein